jgi:hypothetical protein
MAEQVRKRPHGPTAIVASEQDANGHSHDGDQAQRPGSLRSSSTLKNLQNMHEQSLPPTSDTTGARKRIMELEYQDWACLQGKGPHSHVAHTGGHKDRLRLLLSGVPVADVPLIEARDGQ